MIIYLVYRLPAISYPSNGASIKAIDSKETIALYDFLSGPFNFIFRKKENLIVKRSAYNMASSF